MGKSIIKSLASLIVRIRIRWMPATAYALKRRPNFQIQGHPVPDIYSDFLNTTYIELNHCYLSISSSLISLIEDLSSFSNRTFIALKSII
jgi:hypothetical protein